MIVTPKMVARAARAKHVEHRTHGIVGHETDHARDVFIVTCECGVRLYVDTAAVLAEALYALTPPLCICGRTMQWHPTADEAICVCGAEPVTETQLRGRPARLVRVDGVVVDSVDVDE